MKKIILTSVFCVSTLCVFAQSVHEGGGVANKIDTLSMNQVQTVPENDINKKLEEAKKTIEEQEKRISELRNLEIKLSLAENDLTELTKKLEETNKYAEDVEKSLISLASNFLYIPYEAYSIENIAIKAFESVKNENLKQRYNQRYILLKNYRQHLIDLKAYLQRVQVACNGVFQATATEFIDSEDSSIASDLVLKKQPFYLEYIKYDDYQGTFFGGLLQKTEEILKAHTKQKRANMQELVDTINRIQNPAKLDSFDNVIKVVEERLKTVENQ